MDPTHDFISFPGTHSRDIGRQLCLSVSSPLLYSDDTLADFQVAGTVLDAALAVKTDISDGTIALPALFRSLEETLSGLLALSGLRLKSAFLRISVVTSNKRQRSGVLFSQLTQCFIQTYYFASSFLSLAIISFSRANVTNQNTNKPLRALPSDWLITARADTPFVVSQWINALSLKTEIILNRRIIKALRVFTANKW